MFRRCRLMFRHRSTSVFLLLYLFGVAFIFYIGIYSASTVVTEMPSRKCTCINKTSRSQEANNNKHTKTFLLIIVLTGPKNIRRRNAMRMTWLNVTKFPSVSRRFVIGMSDLDRTTRESLEHEQNVHGDMLFLPDFKDQYKQLTRKLLSALLWINENINCSFVMKVDDDSFARLGVIEAELKVKYDQVDNLYWGFHRGSSRVKYSGPWTEPNWILCDRYLPYALGGGYIISRKLVEYISNISSLLVLYNSEDVSLGAWLSPIQLTRVHDPRFDTEWQSRGCRNAHIVSHKQSIEDMYNKCKTLQKDGKLCMKEEFLRESFIYSWNVPPSQCCERKHGIP